jgi:hypothetical protein
MTSKTHSTVKHTSKLHIPNASVIDPLRAVYTCVFCIRCLVRDGANAQQLPLRDHVRDRARKAKKAWGIGAIADGITDAKNSSVDGPLGSIIEILNHLPL